MWLKFLIGEEIHLWLMENPCENNSRLFSLVFAFDIGNDFLNNFHFLLLLLCFLHFFGTGISSSGGDDLLWCWSWKEKAIFKRPCNAYIIEKSVNKFKVKEPVSALKYKEGCLPYIACKRICVFCNAWRNSPVFATVLSPPVSLSVSSSQPLSSSAADVSVSSSAVSPSTSDPCGLRSCPLLLSFSFFFLSAFWLASTASWRDLIFLLSSFSRCSLD